MLWRFSYTLNGSGHGGEGSHNVRFRKGMALQALSGFHAAVSATVVKDLPAVDGLQLVRLPRGLSMQKAVARYQAYPDVLAE